MTEKYENREKLIECAKTEFMEKGFEKASLRKICTDAGLTTGAVYFFFKDKNGLFGAIVDEPIKKISETLINHFMNESGDFATYEHTQGDHDDFAEEFITVMYSYYDELLILITKSQGSKYENIIDDFIDMIEQRYSQLAQMYAASVPGKKVNKYMLHWISHMSINAFVHLITHESDEQKAVKLIKPILNYLVEGWLDLILTDE